MIRDFRKMVHLRHHEIEHTNGSVKGYRPLRRLDLFFDRDPGANAPGFMLPPTPRAGEYTSLKRGVTETDLVNGTAVNTTQGHGQPANAGVVMWAKYM